jgi:hypothetical protein
MRITGLVLLLIGLAVAVFCGVTALVTKAPTESDAVIHADRRQAPDLTIPLVIGVVAAAGGMAMYVYGGRGYDEATPNPPPAVPG